MRLLISTVQSIQITTLHQPSILSATGVKVMESAAGIEVTETSLLFSFGLISPRGLKSKVL